MRLKGERTWSKEGTRTICVTRSLMIRETGSVCAKIEDIRKDWLKMKEKRLSDGVRSSRDSKGGAENGSQSLHQQEGCFIL